jgi:hypothetical protein
MRSLLSRVSIIIYGNLQQRGKELHRRLGLSRSQFTRSQGLKCPAVVYGKPDVSLFIPPRNRATHNELIKVVLTWTGYSNPGIKYKGCRDDVAFAKNFGPLTLIDSLSNSGFLCSICLTSAFKLIAPFPFNPCFTSNYLPFP